MRVRQFRAILITVGLVLLATTQGVAQAVSSAQIHGVVTDSTGASVAGAQVRATQTETGMIRTTVSNSEGSFALPNLPVGPYNLEVSASGFQNYVQVGIILQV